jgi:MtN3 and saliva related transmembrane protein
VTASPSEAPPNGSAGCVNRASRLQTYGERRRGASRSTTFGRLLNTGRGNIFRERFDVAPRKRVKARWRLEASEPSIHQALAIARHAKTPPAAPWLKRALFVRVRNPSGTTTEWLERKEIGFSSKAATVFSAIIESVQTYLAVAAAAWGIAMALAPLLQIRAIRINRSSRGVSVGYQQVLLVGFLVWFAYGVSLGNVALIAANATGVAVSALTIGVALRFRSRQIDGIG